MTMPQLTLAQVADLVSGVAFNDRGQVLRRVAPLDCADEYALSFVANAKYAAYLHTTRAGAVLLPAGMAVQPPIELSGIRVEDPHRALALVLPILHPQEPAPVGIHPTAVVENGAVLGLGVSVGAHAVIGESAVLGDGAVVGAQCVVGRECMIGAETVLHPHVTLYPGTRVGSRCIVHSGARLGSDGFGYVFAEGEHRKVPQVGGCVVEDDVEIGANTTVDRGSVGETVIGRGTKIDNLVHVGHNARLAEKVLVVAQVGISGSTRVGTGAVLGGQAGFAGHLSIGAGARVGAQAGVTTDVPAGETVSGYPARPHRDALRAQAALFRLPGLMRRIKELERLVSRIAGADALRSDEPGDERTTPADHSGAGRIRGDRSP
jgi:UDP-3-O-[3-hydroxymyristoyl] glucosamine N-acyltransferase